MLLHGASTENVRERSAEIERIRVVRKHLQLERQLAALERRPKPSQLLRTAIARDELTGRADSLEELESLSAGRGTEVEHARTGRRRERLTDARRRDVLHLNPTLAERLALTGIARGAG